MEIGLAGIAEVVESDVDEDEDDEDDDNEEAPDLNPKVGGAMTDDGEDEPKPNAVAIGSGLLPKADGIAGVVPPPNPPNALEVEDPNGVPAPPKAEVVDDPNALGDDDPKVLGEDDPNVDAPAPNVGVPEPNAEVPELKPEGDDDVSPNFNVPGLIPPLAPKTPAEVEAEEEEEAEEIEEGEVIEVGGLEDIPKAGAEVAEWSKMVKKCIVIN